MKQDKPTEVGNRRAFGVSRVSTEYTPNYPGIFLTVV